MIKHWQRKTYYALAGPLMWINGRIYRYFRAPAKGLRVHIGPGPNCYLQGWLNVDANIITAKIDLWANLVDPLCLTYIDTEGGPGFFSGIQRALGEGRTFGGTLPRTLLGVLHDLLPLFG